MWEEKLILEDLANWAHGESLHIKNEALLSDCSYYASDTLWFDLLTKSNKTPFKTRLQSV